MPNRPEYQEKLDDMIFFIGDYANIFPYNPDNTDTERRLTGRIQKLKTDIDELITKEPDTLKRYISSVYDQYIALRNKWVVSQEMWNAPE